jgi:protein arginine kinase activator
MLCQLCNRRNASVFVKKIENGEKIEYNLCDECASELMNPPIEITDVEEDFFDNLADMLAGFSDVKREEREEAIKCLKCGMTFSEFQHGGRLGCEDCYEVFEQQLKPLLQRIQGAIQHAGKYPPEHEKKQEVEKLKEELKELIEKEEYERAAIIRDKIKELEQKKDGNESK